MNNFNNLLKTLLPESDMHPSHMELKNYLTNKVKTSPEQVVDMLFDIFTEPDEQNVVDEFYRQIQAELGKNTQPNV